MELPVNMLGAPALRPSRLGKLVMECGCSWLLVRIQPVFYFFLSLFTLVQNIDVTVIILFAENNFV